jgi:hypothetical protein
MSIFRPSARVTSPDGREWELYAYKVKLRDLGGATDDPGRRERFLVRLVLLVPRALIGLGHALEALRSDEWTIDAITFYPQQTVHTWTATSEYKGQVLAQVEGHLARGHVPLHLTNAVYRRSAR